MNPSHLSEPAKHALDYSIAGAGLAFGLKMLPVITGIVALALIILRIVIGVQEWKINKRLLDEDQ